MRDKEELVIGFQDQIFDRNLISSFQYVHYSLVDHRSQVLAEREVVVTPFGIRDQIVVEQWH